MRDMADITAAILVGGRGTRLQSVVSDRPKVLAEISGKPFLAYLFDQLLNLGIRKVVLCSGYMADKIEACFRDRYDSLNIQYSKEDQPLGTGGGFRLALPYLASETILVMNGDSYIDADLRVYVNWFFEKDGQAALLLAKVDDTSRYGTVCVDEDRIIAFEEKKKCSGPDWINAGVYLLNSSLISSIPSGEFYSLERQFFPGLIKQGLFGFRSGGQFIDIGTPKSYAVAETFFMDRTRRKIL